LTSSSFIASRCGLPVRGVWLAVALNIVSAMAPTFVLADVQVRGSPEAASIVVQDASVEEILAALSAAFGVHYRSLANLEKRINGTYEGPLQRVVARILDGNNFFMKAGEGGIEIKVLGTGATRVGAGATFKGAERRVDAAAAQPLPAIAAAEEPVPLSPQAAPAPEIKLAERPAPPLTSPAPSASGSAPTLVTEPGPAATPLAAPPAPAPGSTPGPISQAGPSAVIPPLAAGTTPSPLPPAH